MPPLIIGILSTSIFILGIYWQVIVFIKDSKNGGIRHIIAYGLMWATILGGIGYTIFVAIDPNIEIGLWGGLKLILTAIAVGFLFIIKQAFGPILLSSSAAWAMYMLLQHGELELIPLIKWLVDFLFSSKDLGVYFILFTAVYALIGSIYSSLSDMG